MTVMHDVIYAVYAVYGVRGVCLRCVICTIAMYVKIYILSDMVIRGVEIF